jgi:hypothetical protein
MWLRPSQSMVCSLRRKVLWDNAQRLYKVMGPSAADDARRAAAVGA